MGKNAKHKKVVIQRTCQKNYLSTVTANNNHPLNAHSASMSKKKYVVKGARIVWGQNCQVKRAKAQRHSSASDQETNSKAEDNI